MKLLQYLMLILLIYSVNATAISSNSNLPGSLNILPYFSAHESNSTLLSIRNHKQVGLAARVKLLDSDGKVITEFNMYLPGNNTFVASLSETDGQFRLNFPGPHCALFNEKRVLSLDFGTGHGYIEIYETGFPAGNEQNVAVEVNDCQFLEQEWGTGSWSIDSNDAIEAPGNSLSSQVQIINVPAGTIYTIPSVNVQNFSDLPLHTPTASSLPDLSSAHDSGTDNESTRATKCNSSECIETTWKRPEEAIAFLLLGTQFSSEFVATDSIGATSEWVLTNPLRNYFEVDSRFRGSSIKVAVSDRNGQSINNGPLCPPVIADFCEFTYEFSSDASQHFLSFNTTPAEVGTETASQILGHPYQGRFSLGNSGINSGMATIGIESLGFPTLISNEGLQFRGLPVIGLAFQLYINGQIIDQNTGNRILANYGAVSKLIGGN